jgi:5'-3' exonuclease
LIEKNGEGRSEMEQKVVIKKYGQKRHDRRSLMLEMIRQNVPIEAVLIALNANSIHLQQIEFAVT